MKKVKIILTYFVAILCILTTLFYKPKEIEVFKTTTEMSDKMMIYMMDEENNLVPVTLNIDSKESDEENVLLLIELMKKEYDLYELNRLISDSISCLGVNIQNNLVQIDFNEAFYAMNSDHELRLIEGIVSSVIQLNPDYKVEFLVNHEKVNSMPLSRLPMVLFDSSLGVNNFKLDVFDLHDSVPRQVVQLKSNEESEYYVVSTKRVSYDMDHLEFVNDVIREISYDLECIKIEYNQNEWILHLNEKFLSEENIVEKDYVLSLLYTLKMNQFADTFTIKIHDDVVYVEDFPKNKLTFHDLNLNVFEE